MNKWIESTNHPSATPFYADRCPFDVVVVPNYETNQIHVDFWRFLLQPCLTILMPVWPISSIKYKQLTVFDLIRSDPIWSDLIWSDPTRSYLNACYRSNRSDWPIARLPARLPICNLCKCFWMKSQLRTF